MLITPVNYVQVYPRRLGRNSFRIPASESPAYSSDRDALYDIVPFLASLEIIGQSEHAHFYFISSNNNITSMMEMCLAFSHACLDFARKDFAYQEDNVRFRWL